MIASHVIQRRTVVTELAGQGKSLNAIRQSLTERGMVNPRTSKAWSKQTVRSDLSAQPVREIIGRQQNVSQSLWSSRFTRTVDATQVDYEFWDKFRRCLASGYQFAGLFAKPITQIITSWVYGSGVTAKLADAVVDGDEESPEAYTNDLLARFLTRIHSLLTQVVEDHYGLGNQYLVVNPDSSISVATPDSVEKFVDEIDYRKTVRYVLTTKLEKATVTDEYRLDGRTVTIKFNDNRPDVVQNYANLIGRLPIVHLHCDRGTNEIFGRPIYEALLRLFARYDDLIEKGLDGAELSGNPIPSFQGMEDPNSVQVHNGASEDETYTDRYGNTETRKVINFDRNSIVVVGKGGEFVFVSPPSGFSADIREMLKSLFLLLLDHTRIAEYMWGGEVSSGRSSTETQADPFNRFIEARRAALAGEGADEVLDFPAEGGIYELLDIWLRTRALIDPKVVVAPVALTWPELSAEDEELKLKWIEFLSTQNVITDETKLRQADLDGVEDIEAEVEAAQAEAEEKQAAFDERAAAQIDALAKVPDGAPKQPKPKVKAA